MTEKKTKNGSPARYIIVTAIILAAFLGSYSLAVAKAGKTTVDVGTAGILAATPALNGTAGAGSGSACACCGSGSSTPIEGAATVEGDVQKISVDLSTGSYDPNVIKLKAGIPTEITFGQSSGCTAEVLSKDLGFYQDLTGGPVTVKLPALDAGTYSFSCGMEMVFGSIVVE
ncbi:MAG: cupredoxin domain-containing protein [Actinobacteria bacterium]|nr:MAG: cupredoxin domain-containing protein [Actinomycetota bacterium]